MTDIFFSYSSKDRERVRPIRDGLVALGYVVFWDQEVPPGQDWDEWIRGYLDSSRCVIVFWSAESIKSRNVRHEAALAATAEKLIPVLLDAVDVGRLPLGHYMINGANLGAWTGDVRDAQWQKVLNAVEAKAPVLDARKISQLLIASRAEVAELKSGSRGRWLSRTVLVLSVLASAALAAAAWTGSRPLLGLSQTPGMKGCQPKSDGPYASGIVSYDFCAQGVGRMTTEWSKLSEFKGPMGLELLDRLEKDRNSTWYIINMSPYGLARSGKMTPLVTKAYERNIDVKWAFQSSDDAAANRTLQYQWLWLYAGEKEIECRATKKALCEGVGKFATAAAELAWDSRPKARFETDARWTTYYSSAPTFYFALISVPGRIDDHIEAIARGEKAPPGTFGYVVPYAHFAQYDVRPAFYFDGSKSEAPMGSAVVDDLMLTYYYRSTVLYFSEGLKPGRAYLREAPDPRDSKAVLGTVCADGTIPDYKNDEVRRLCEKPTGR